MGMPTVVKVLGGYLEVDMGETGGGGAPGYPSHPWVPPPGSPTHPWVPPGGSPSHPWVPPSGTPEHPWVRPPGSPTHPIPPGYWGGAPIGGGEGGGGQPPGYWGGTPPVYIDIGPPGPQPQPPEDQSKIEWHTGWSADKGWVTVGIVTPEFPHPTPSS
jgi:hypothetical protein